MRAEKLIARYGSPLWLADVDRFRANLRAFELSWSARWPKIRVAYSYKTNRLLAFVRAAALAGASAEVVCEAEYELDAVGTCSRCFGPLDLIYDRAELARTTREQIESGPRSLWRSRPGSRREPARNPDRSAP